MAAARAAGVTVEGVATEAVAPIQAVAAREPPAAVGAAAGTASSAGSRGTGPGAAPHPEPGALIVVRQHRGEELVSPVVAA